MDEPRSSNGSVVAYNATTAMVLQHCNNDGVATLLLLRHYGATVTAVKARNDGPVAALAAALLELAAALCSVAGAGNTMYVVVRVAAAGGA